MSSHFTPPSDTSEGSDSDSSASSSSQPEDEDEVPKDMPACNCGPCCPEDEPERNCKDTDEPVNFFTGLVRLSAVDVQSRGYGEPLAHKRIYSNITRGAFTRGNGYLWEVENWPRLADAAFPQQDLDSVITSLGNVGASAYWTKDELSDQYNAMFGSFKQLFWDKDQSIFHMYDGVGKLTVFDDINKALTFPGLVKSMTSPGGITTEVELDAEEIGVGRMTRTFTQGGDAITESLKYDWLSLEGSSENGSGGGEGGLLLRTTLVRTVDGGSPENILKAEYTYYGPDSAFGLEHDLETVTRFEWRSGAWVQLDVTYYRTYVQDPPPPPGSSESGASCGPLPHGLKYVVGPQAWENMLADSIDPLTASDAIIAQYADFYFEYDGEGRACHESTDGGKNEYSFEYEDNPTPPPTDDYYFNWWYRKTTQTRPDGSQRIVFSNKFGNCMLDILKDGEDEWYSFYTYDGSGREVMRTDSAAVTGYDETKNDLLDFDEDTDEYLYLSNEAGLLTHTSYTASGRVASKKIQHSQAGSLVKLQDFAYAEHSVGDNKVEPVSKQTVYPSDTNPTLKIETTYAYTYHTDTVQVDQKTTTLPVIPTSQNGSNSANSFIDVFDVANNRIWHKDERGFITGFKYDIPSGAIMQQIDDVDSGEEPDVPDGWTTPAGGGLNLVTDYEHDDRGRITQVLGPAHAIDLDGTATEVRTVQWTVYKDAENRTVTASGYQVVSSGEFTLVNPVSITVRDRNGNVTESIQAVRASTSGKLQPTDTFDQSTYVRWTTNQYTECCLLASTRVYHTIPASGEGASGTNYDQTDFGYDDMQRRNRVQTPGGTITFTVFDVRSLPVEVYVGTNDTGATQDDPTGGGAAGNNMVLLTGNVYDDGEVGLDGNLTEQTQHVDGGTARVTAFEYDWRNRQTVVDGEIDFYQESLYDNLDRVVKVDRRNTDGEGNLIARSETKYDDLGRVFQSIVYGVNPASGVVGNPLTDNIWYDPAGNVMKSLPAGSKLFTKTTYDGLNRPLITYRGYDTSSESYAEAGSVADDTILEQTERTYDDGSNVVETAARQRYHNATGDGPLAGPAVEPKARVTWSASWPDGVGRVQATAAYGTNGGTALSRPDTIPARSDDCLVASTIYNDDGTVQSTTDPIGMVTKFEYDDGGRQTKLIENFLETETGSSSSSAEEGCPASDDANRTTATAYAPDGQVSTLTAWNTATGNQTTTYTYGTTLSDSAVASSSLLRSVTYPDSVGGSDVVSYTYNRLGQQTTVTDQNGTVRAFDYDLLGRPIHDRVTTLGTGVDGAVRRLSTTYEVRGLVVSLTSHNDPDPGEGAVVNEVLREYNAFGQVTMSQQAHGGSVNVSFTPKVQYGYADGSSNTIRQNMLVYPDTRILHYEYVGGMDSALSRVSSLAQVAFPSPVTLVQYQYLGLSTAVIVDYPQPELMYTLVGTAGGTDPDTGDIYHGLDRFGRIKDAYWRDYGSDTDAARIQYGYNRASSRIWRKDPVATANSAQYDELYAYDGLQRLSDMQRGTLNGTETGLTSETFAQCWTLDALGNWGQMREAATGGAWTLEQERTANTVNEITGIAASVGTTWVTPAYDPAGNMTTIPQPKAPTEHFTGTYDAWNRLVRLMGPPEPPESSASSDSSSSSESSTSNESTEWSESSAPSVVNSSSSSFSDSSSSSSSTEPEEVLIAEYEYDARRFRIVEKSYEDGELSETRHVYFTESWQAIEERLGASPEPAPAERQYTWGQRYLDDLVLRNRDQFDTGELNEPLYALQDANWNVIAIASNTGDTRERYAYSAYGNPLFLSPSYGARADSTYVWETLYSGYHWSAVSELFGVRFRTYHSLLGRWMTRDPAEYVVSMNLTSYVDDTPLASYDPLGLAGPTSHHIFSQGQKWLGLLKDLCHFDSIDNTRKFVDQFTSQVAGMERGTPHHFLQHNITGPGGQPQGWNQQVLNIYETATDCCEALTGVRNLHNRASDEMYRHFFPNHRGPRGPLPLGPHPRGNANPLRLCSRAVNELLDQTIKDVCEGRVKCPYPSPAPYPVLAPEIAPPIPDYRLHPMPVPLPHLDAPPIPRYIRVDDWKPPPGVLDKMLEHYIEQLTTPRPIRWPFIPTFPPIVQPGPVHR